MLSPSGDGDGRFARSYALDGLTIDLSYLIVVYSECEVFALGEHNLYGTTLARACQCDLLSDSDRDRLLRESQSSTGSVRAMTADEDEY